MTALPRSSGVTDLLRPTSFGARIEHLRDEGLADADGLAWVLERAEELVHDDADAADELAALCDRTASLHQLASVNARARYLRARVCSERGELDRALELLDEARALYWESGDHLPALRTGLGRMQVLDDLGRHADAVEVGMVLIAALDDVVIDAGDEELRTWMRAAALENVGVACGFVGEHEQALDAYERAATAYRALGMADETARPLANRGIELIELGRGREALELLREADAIFGATGDRMWSAKCRGHIAHAHEQLGQLVESLRVLEPARATLDELGATAEGARIQLAIAGVYLAVGLNDEAGVEAAAAAERTIAAGMVHDAAMARFTSALARLGAGDLEQAHMHLTAAATLFDEVGDRQYRARVMLAEAEIAAAHGRRADAQRLAGEAAATLEAGGWLVPLTWAHLRLADSAADDVVASTHLQHATELVRRLGLPQLQYQCDVRAARLHRRHGRVEDAERLLLGAVDHVDRLGASLPDHALRNAFRADRLAAHDELVDLLVERGGAPDLAEAARISDRSKARTLEDLRAGTVGAPVHAAGASELAGELGQLMVDLNATYGALLVATPDRAPSMRRRAAGLEQRISALHVRSTVTAPDVMPAQFAVRRPAAGSTPQGGSVAPTLAYHVVGGDVVAFFTTSDGDTSATRLTGAVAEVATQLDRLGAQWSRFRMGAAFTGRHQATLVDTARLIMVALHDVLVAPLAERLAAEDGDHLVVVPHRRLGEVPFHALHDGSAYLLDRWAITVAPSLTERIPPALDLARPALVLARPDAHAPSIAAEASALIGLLPGARVLVGEEATTAALVAGVPGPGIVHIACHGLYRAANPLFSSLSLADRWMTAAEVLDLDLGGALVTLSACESGRHGVGTAEPVGLAWAFLAAGAAGVVVSQWLVHDDVTASGMAEMYRHVVAGVAPAEALRRAQRTIAEDHPHPYHWAPFTYVAPHATTRWEHA